MPSLCKVFTLQLHIFSLLLLYLCTFAFATLHPGIFALTAKVQVAPMEHHIAQKVYDRTVSVKLWREQEEVWAKFFPLYVKTRYWSFFFEKLPQTKSEWMCKRNVCISCRSFVDTFRQYMSTALWRYRTSQFKIMIEWLDMFTTQPP